MIKSSVEIDFTDIEYAKGQIATFKEQLMGTDANYFNSLSVFERIPPLIEYATALVFFPDHEILQKFKELKVNRSTLKFLLPLDELLCEFERIESTGKIKVKKGMALKCIFMYLYPIILNEIISWAGFIEKYKGDPEASSLYAKTHRELRKRKYYRRRKKEALTPEQAALYEAVTLYTSILGDQEKAEKFILKYTKGKPDNHFLRLLFSDCLIYDESLSDNEIYSSIFDLLFHKLEIKKVLNEDQFLECEKYYGKNYQW